VRFEWWGRALPHHSLFYLHENTRRSERALVPRPTTGPPVDETFRRNESTIFLTAFRHFPFDDAEREKQSVRVQLVRRQDFVSYHPNRQAGTYFIKDWKVTVSAHERNYPTRTISHGAKDPHQLIAHRLHGGFMADSQAFLDTLTLGSRAHHYDMAMVRAPQG